MWTTSKARDLASEQLGAESPRWAHVQAVGTLAELWVSRGLVGEVVAVAAWLHDIGYAPALRVSGFHSLDGAWFLRGLGAPAALVALVARHTGAEVEALQRGLTSEFDLLPRADQDDLDVLTLSDLVCGPEGDLVTPDQRITEIYSRYAEDDPVHRSVARSSAALLASAVRARARLGLPDEWPLVGAEGVLEAHSH